MTTSITTPDQLLALKSTLSGSVLLPDDPGYDDARRIFNALIRKRPGIVVRCTDARDVSLAVRFGVERGVEISVRGCGHGVAGTAITDGGLMIDLSEMKRITVDPDARVARAEPGLNWGELNAATQAHGLAVTGGVVSTTGIAGLTVGGGIGWLMGRFGIAADNLLSAEVVTASGEVVTASETSHPDLFWALRGGGGNFGIVTSFEYRLHEVGPTVTGGLVMFPFDDAPDVLRFYREFTTDAPDTLMASAGLLRADEGAGPRVSGMVLCHSGTLEEAEHDLAPLMAFGTPLVRQIGPLSYSEVNRLFDPGYPYGLKNYWKSNFLRELSDEVIDVMVEGYSRCPSPRGSVVVELFHGEVTRIARDAIAYPHRDAGYNAVVQSIWQDDSPIERHVDWARDVFGRLQPFAKQSTYVNYLGEEDVGDQAVRAAFGDNYPRLVEVKDRYDPTNVFRLNTNVVPTGWRADAR